jgi:hypothetical protein
LWKSAASISTLRPQLSAELVRHGQLAQSRVVRALFALRTLASRLAADNGASPTIRTDDLTSSPAQPGFQILVDDPPHEVAVGAIGKVWHLDIPFVHVPSAHVRRFPLCRRPGRRVAGRPQGVGKFPPA